MMGVLAFLVDLLSGAFLIAGAGFFLIGAIGLNRMPDVFSRTHAASVADTLGLGFLLIGMLLQAGFTLVAVKILFIFALIFLTAPIAAHALARAALHDGEKPLIAGEDGALAPKDPAEMFPELEERLKAPLVSESVSAGAARLPGAEIDPDGAREASSSNS